MVAESLWGSTPMITFAIAFSCFSWCRLGRRGGQCYYELGSPLSSHASSTVPDGLQTGGEPHRHLVGSRVESPPPDTWTESGQTPALREVSSSRLSAHRCLPDLPMRVSPLIRDMHVIDADRGHPTTLRRARMDAGIEGAAMPRRLLHRPPVVIPGSDQEPSSKAVTSSRLKAGRSSGLRLLTRTQPLAGHTCTSLSTHSAPALVRSVARLGQDVIVLPRTTFASISDHDAWQMAAMGLRAATHSLMNSTAA